MASNIMLDVLDTLVYFGVAATALCIGFIVLDLLTPGKLHQLVFIDHLPNAAFIAGGQQIALGIVVTTAVYTSASEHSLVEGLIEATVFSILGIVLQAVSLVILEVLIPGRFRDIVEDTKLRAGAIVASISLIVIGAVNAACLT